MRLCKCGAIVTKGLCEKCRPPAPKHKRTTAERGYDHHWRRHSEALRDHHQECRVCVAKGSDISVAEEMHHIEKIRDAPHLKHVESNLVPVCGACHREIEGMTRQELDSYLAKLEQNR